MMPPLFPKIFLQQYLFPSSLDPEFFPHIFCRFWVPAAALFFLFLFGQRATLSLQQVACRTRWTGAQVPIFRQQRRAGRNPYKIAEVAKSVLRAWDTHG